MTVKQTNQITMLTGLLLLAAIGLHLAGFMGARDAILIASSVLAGIPIAYRAFQALKMRAFSIQLLVTIVVIGALWIGEYVESAAVTFLFLFGGYLEARTLEKTRSSLKKLMDMAPLTATIIRDGETVVVPVDEVNVGDRVIIRSGEKVAVDGAIVGGQATLNEAAITGESVPVRKTTSDKLFGGTIIESGYVEMIAEQVGDDTTFAKIIELVEEAQESKAKTEKFLDRFANMYTPSVVGLSMLIWLVTRDVHLSLTFLVIACPGALIISAPVSIVAGIGNGARHGVLIKGGETMERLAKIDTVVFDKTGTLTRGKPVVTDLHSFGMDADELLRLTAEAETISEHHLGRTIVQEARERGLQLTRKPDQTEVLKGLGILASVAGRHLIIGNRKLMQASDVVVSEEAEAVAATREELGNTAIFAAVDGELAGIFSIADQIRADAPEAIRKLRADGVKKIVILTGDNRHTAELVGAELGIDEVHAELLPEHKVAYVRQLKEAGRHVAMAGDGINDAPAIAAADIGLAMGEGGTDISMETADVVLMADRLSQFAHAYSLAKATIRNMKQNTYFAVGTVLLLLVGVLLGRIFLASGMLIHEFSVIAVILNAIRLTKYTESKRNVRQWKVARAS